MSITSVHSSPQALAPNSAPAQQPKNLEKIKAAANVLAEPLFSKLAEPNPLNNALATLLHYKKNKNVEAVMNLLMIQSQLTAWKHFYAYVRSRRDYEDEVTALRSQGKAIMLKQSGQPIDAYLARTHALMEEFIFALNLYLSENVQFDPRVFLETFAKENDYFGRIEKYCTKLKKCINKFYEAHFDDFVAFKASQKEENYWPFPEDLRRTIEEAGFKCRPKVFLRDRCKCKSCGLIMKGWRPWSNPWIGHNPSKHTDEFNAKAGVKAGQYATPAVFKIERLGQIYDFMRAKATQHLGNNHEKTELVALFTRLTDNLPEDIAAQENWKEICNKIFDGVNSSS